MVPPDPRFKCDSSANFATFYGFHNAINEQKRKKRKVKLAKGLQTLNNSGRTNPCKSNLSFRLPLWPDHSRYGIC